MRETFQGLQPEVHETAFVHPAATLIGEVVVSEEASVWPGTVLRGDVGPIVVGPQTSIQDNSVAHATGGLSETVIGARVTVGHRVVLHGCRVGDDCIVGMGSVLMDNAELGAGSILGAGSVVPPGKKYPPGVLVLGTPARVVREVTDEERAWIARSWKVYVELIGKYRAG